MKLFSNSKIYYYEQPKCLLDIFKFLPTLCIVSICMYLLRLYIHGYTL